MPRRIRPMLAMSAPGPFDSPDHLFEPKWDGLRAVGFREGGRAWLQSRRGFSYRTVFPEVVRALERAAGPDRLVVDGELVAAFPDGRPNFAAVLARSRMQRPAAVAQAAREWPASFVVFDLLYEGEEDLRGRPLSERRARLERWASWWGDGRLVLSPAVAGAGRRLFEAARLRGLEGVMAKAVKSRYLDGRRTPAWLKIKAFVEAEAVIVGLIPSGRDGVRSLAVALPDGRDGEGGRLEFAGLVGTGLPSAEQRRLRALLDPLRVPAPPVATPGSRPELAAVVWVRPEIRCRVRLLERTPDGWLRHASYRGLVG